MRPGAVARWAGAVLLCAACTAAEPAGPTEPAEPAAAGATGSSPGPTTADCRPTPGGADGPVAAPPDTPSRIRLGPGREVERSAETVAVSRSGEPLLVTGVVYAADCRTPLAGATVEAWQTDAKGRYGPGGSSSTGSACCYLQGQARTDGQGRYALVTVVPGRYAGPNPPPRHVHLAVSHPQAQSVTTEVMFAGDPGAPATHPLAVTATRSGSGQRLEFDIVLQRRR
jgi:hypothetical protein